MPRRFSLTHQTTGWFLLWLLQQCSFSLSFSLRYSPSSRAINCHRSTITLKLARRYDPSDRPTAAPYSSQLKIIDTFKQNCLSMIQQNEFTKALASLRNLLEYTKTLQHKATSEYASQAVDLIVQQATSTAFAPRATQQRILWGTQIVQLQLAATHLTPPYNMVPRQTLLAALRALTRLAPTDTHKSNHCQLAYRILQRLITGVGVRSRKTNLVTERDFNKVLNVFAEVGNMNMAHRIVALQERTALPLTPVAISILLKGYGRRHDLTHVDMVLAQAQQNGIAPDIIMWNSLIDAYVNCQALDKAKEAFQRMKTETAPNIRTYNTILKGLANSGSLDYALELTEEMKEKQLWDAVTTNTLVHAALVANDLILAENILAEHTLSIKQAVSRHPNVEAYTELLDAYAKAGKMDQAMSILALMRERGVAPNEYTYTCLVNGLGRSQQVEKARRVLEYMNQVGPKPSAVTYNALISGLVSRLDQPSSVDTSVDEALKILREMIQGRVRPNVVTVSVLVDALGRCSHPRVIEAKTLVDRLECQEIIPTGHPQVTTALVQTCGYGHDIKGALQAFQKIRKPDTVAINAFLMACFRCDRDRLAVQSFDFYFRGNGLSRVKPDVISYSVLISICLRKNSADSRKKAKQLYEDMKMVAKICPDTKLVDMILKAMIRIARTNGLSDSDVNLILSVLRDAEHLRWEEGQLIRRKQAIRVILSNKVRNALKTSHDLNDIFPPDDTEDALFRKKGWNKVDSGFRLWGGGPGTVDDTATTSQGQTVDQFLKSKGWNSVDSGFRVI